MKKNRVLALLLTLTLLLSATLSGCGGVSGKSAVKYGDLELSRAIFQYLCCLEKTNYLFEIYGVDSSQVSASSLQDYPELWTATDQNGVTVGDTMKGDILFEVQTMLYFEQVALDAGYTLTPEIKSQIQKDFNQRLVSFDNKSDFNKNMKQYGINYDQLIEYAYHQNLAYQGTQLYFGENGTMKITEDSAKSYYNANYVTAQCIFINTKNKTYPNGKVVVLPSEEKAEKIALAQDLYQRILGGEDFGQLCLEYADQAMSENRAQNGYTFTKDGFFNKEAENKILEMKVGDFVKLETDEGIYLLRRLTLDSSFFSQMADSIRQELQNAKMLSIITGEAEKFILDEDFLNSLDIPNLPHLV